jgi:secreted trypsin-like serine protease
MRFLFCAKVAIWLAVIAFLFSISAISIDAAAGKQLSHSNMGSTSRIISGEFAPDDRYPYAVSIHRQGRRHHCGGSLIAPNLILSAAHCSGAYFGHVFINYYNLSDSAPRGQEVFGILHEFVHPRYNYIDYPYDFMVIMINGNSSISPVKLNRKSVIPRDNETLTVIGWGRTDTQGNYTPSDVLKEAEVTTFSQSDCRAYWLASAHEVTDDMMCAMAKTGINCRGDSGSPLLLLGRNASDDIQVGLVSWGPLQCDLPNTPSVYSRVTDQMDWIDSIICRYSSEPPDNLDCSSHINDTTADNQFSKSNTTGIGEVLVSVVLNLDGRPYETGFFLEDENGVEVYRINPGTYGPGTSRAIESVVLDANRQYNIALLDAANDGFCCENGTGSFDIYLEDNKHLLLSGDGDFETFTRAAFVTSNRGGRFESAKLVGKFPILLRFETKLSPIKLAWTLFQVDTDNRPVVASVEAGTYVGSHIVEDEIIMGVQGGLYSLTFIDPDNIHRFAVFVGGTTIENSTVVASGHGKLYQLGLFCWCARAVSSS